MATLTIHNWESQLILRAREGDHSAFERLTDQYRPLLLGLAVRKLQNRDDANDVVQDTFMKAFRNLRDFDTDRPIRPWLSRICMNCIVDFARHRRNNVDSIDQYEYSLADDSSAIEEAEGSIQRRQILEAIARLPYRYRRIVMMRHFDQMDVSEIAAELRKPEGTIKSWLFRARAMLKRDLANVLV